MTRQTRTRRTVALGVSLVVHAGALAILATRLLPAASPPPLAPPSITLDLTPDPRSRTQPQAQPQAHAAQTAARAAARETSRAAPLPPPSATAVPSPLRPPTPPSVSAPSPAAAGSDRWAVQGAGAHPAPLPGYAAGAGLQGLVRATVGCSHAAYVRLDAEEKAKCDKGYAEAARGSLKVDALPAEKRAYYDAVQKAYAMDHAATPVAINPEIGSRSSQFGVAERWSGPPGAHMPGFGCKLPVGPPPRDWKSYHDKPPHSLKLGPLPCFVTPPAGFGTEEADIQAPASLRERTDDAAHAAKSDAPP